MNEANLFSVCDAFAFALYCFGTMLVLIGISLVIDSIKKTYHYRYDSSDFATSDEALDEAEEAVGSQSSLSSGQ